MSRKTSNSDLSWDAQSLRSQKTNVSITLYRYGVLNQAKIYILPISPPKEIQLRIDGIFKHQLSTKRKAEISDIAKTTAQQFAEALLGANREDDLTEPLQIAIKAMDTGGLLGIPRKAGNLVHLTQR